MFQNKIYQYNVMPNELSSAPRLFTKLLKVTLSYIRQQTGLNILGYLDDTLFCSQSDTDLQEGSLVAISVFTELEFIISDKKSVLVPTRQIEFLGFRIDSEYMVVSLSKDKAEKIEQQVSTLNQCTIRQC